MGTPHHTTHHTPHHATPAPLSLSRLSLSSLSPIRSFLSGVLPSRFHHLKHRSPSTPPPQAPIASISVRELVVKRRFLYIMADICTLHDETINKEAPQLVSLLKEMKEGLDVVRSKVQTLTAKVKTNQFPTADGMSYLEAKHLLLLNYSQSLVYYLLRKAKGFSIQGHPVVRSLVEIRLFLEKIRPIDKKLQYQIQKLTRVTAGTAGPNEKETNASPQETEDLLRYRPNPDMLVSKTDNTTEDGTGVYRPPKFAPTSMEEDKMSKQEKNALRRDKELLRQSRQSAYVRELMDDLEGRPEEVREAIGAESRELTRYREKWEERSRREEELFTRAPITKMEKKREKHLKKSRNGLLGLTESFYDEIKTLPIEDDLNKETTDFSNGSGRMAKFNKRKRKH